MLLQIAEPGSMAPAACRKRVVGIDLGTTNSLVGYVRDGDAVVIGAATGDALVPSVVRYGEDGSVQIGAVPAGRQDGRTLRSIKRLMGRARDEVQGLAAGLGYAIEGDVRGAVVRIADKLVTPVEVSAQILGHLRARAEAELDGPLDGVVITVPAYFDDAQRQATREAGRAAGLEVLRLLAEPTAAALAYGLDRGTRGTYAVYDLGGGTFDVSILSLVDGVFEVRSIGGDSALGGDDFDRALAVGAWTRVHGQAPAQLAPALIAAARACKEALTTAASATLVVGGVACTVSRAEAQAWVQPLLDRTAKACRRALKDAERSWAELDGVILVGGSTKSPLVADFVRELSGHAPLCSLDPELVVAMGAAIQAEVLGGGAQQAVLIDVVPLSLGLEMMGGVVEKLIHRNTTIPCGATQTFTTYADNQTGFDLHVVQGEREQASDCRSLARFTLRGVPPMVAGMARIEVTFQIDADGILTVAAHELTTNLAAEITVRPSFGLTDEDVERMLVESFEYAEADLAQRNLAIERVEAERILAATERAIARDGLDGPALLTDDVRAAGGEAMEALRRAMTGTDYLAIRQAVVALDVATKPFAQARMNLALDASMRGRSLDDVERQVGEP